jgi:hypothetical protein
MNGRRAGGAALVVALAALVGGCDLDTKLCLDRGQATTASGSFVATFGTRASTGPKDVVLDDLDPSKCPSSNHEEFTVRIGACLLRANVTRVEHDTGRESSGAFLGATASVQPDQSCTLDAASDSFAFSVATGTLSLTPGRLSLTVAGQAIASGGEDAFLTVSFDGPISIP